MTFNFKGKIARIIDKSNSNYEIYINAIASNSLYKDYVILAEDDCDYVNQKIKRAFYVPKKLINNICFTVDNTINLFEYVDEECLFSVDLKNIETCTDQVFVDNKIIKIAIEV